MTKGERIKKLRLNYNYTLDEIADKLGTSRQTIFKYENNIVTNIPSDKIEQLALIFNVSPAYIMGWDEKKKKEKNNKQSRIWKNVKQARENNNISQEELAELANMSLNLIKEIEENKKIPDYETIVKLAEILKCEVSYLFFGDELNSYDFTIMEKIDNIMESDDEARKKVVKASVEFSDEDIMLLERIIDALNTKKAD